MVKRYILALLMIIGLLAATLQAAPARAAEEIVDGIPVNGRILATAISAGGGSFDTFLTKFGNPEAVRQRLTVSGRFTYHQHFANGDVFWSSLQGGRTWLDGGAKPNIAGVSNDRDALYRYGFDGGQLMRSAYLNGITARGKQLLVAQMHGGYILDLRTHGTADPNFPYVTEKRIGIPGHFSTSNLFVTGSAERSGISKVMQFIADHDAPIWVHCKVGRDRTGVVVVLTMIVLGARENEYYEEYLRTGSAEKANLDKFFAAIEKKYGTPDKEDGALLFLKDIGVTETDFDNIRHNLGA